MGTTQKYSLKWNDFTVNVASTFRDLHSRHDFVDVTLACSDGSTLEAHKVILSSVSTYFRDILKTTPCKHPIIILKDTGRDEASAMLEFAYTGEVNVAQELLPSLLQTARAFRIKGLDKVESPIDIPPPVAHQQPQPRVAAESPAPNPDEHWAAAAAAAAGSAPATRSHTPSSSHSQQDVKMPFFLEQDSKSHDHTHLINGRRDLSPPPSLPNSQPPTREASPMPQANGGGSNSRTPPPKRWKRSFDMTQPNVNNGGGHDQALPMVPENYSTTRPDFEPSKRFCEPSAISGRSLPYPHSMPTSPTMFERGNEIRLAGLFRHHLANTDSSRSAGIVAAAAAVAAASDRQQRPDIQTTSTPIASPRGDFDPVDYRCYPTKHDQRAETVYNVRNGRGCLERQEEEEDDRYMRNSVAFRPESAPTVLDMSPEESLSGPPSLRNHELNDSHRDGTHDHDDEDEYGDCVSKGFSITPDAMGRYSCDECGKIFKHPGSLQHHRHIHRGTHRCPSCGKAFSRRWDMERHLNKSKYGCPANRFSVGSAGSTGSSGSGGGGAAAAVLQVAQPSVVVAAATPVSGVQLQLLTTAAAVSNDSNTTI